jgi:hypothetical protein
MNSLDTHAAPARRRRAKRTSPRGWALARFYTTFVLRTFYSVAIRRCPPGPARWP